MDKKKSFFVMPPIPMDLKLLLGPLGIMLALIVLFMILFKVGFARLGVQKSEIEKANKDIQILKTRQEVLIKIESILKENSKFFVTIFPEENPSLVVFSQIKNAALFSGLVPSNFRAGSETQEGDLKKTNITFDVVGDISGIFSLTRSLQELAPIIVLDRIKFGEVEGGIGATLTIKTYWAKTLNKLPAITEPIKDLTAEEQGLITKIAGLTQPNFGELPATGMTGRTEPF